MGKLLNIYNFVKQWNIFFSVSCGEEGSARPHVMEQCQYKAFMKVGLNVLRNTDNLILTG